jgi:hypothetical protein
MTRRISRAKQAIADSGTPFEVPHRGERAERLAAVLHVLYLIFTEGYAATSGPGLLRQDLSAQYVPNCSRWPGTRPLPALPTGKPPAARPACRTSASCRLEPPASRRPADPVDSGSHPLRHSQEAQWDYGPRRPSPTVPDSIVSMTDEDLISLERQGWQALTTEHGASYYRDHLADDAVMAFPFGVISRSQAIEAIAAAPPWSRYELTDAKVIRLGEDAAVVVYHVRAQRGRQPEFVAVASSTFVRASGSWRLAFHQQSPTN